MSPPATRPLDAPTAAVAVLAVMPAFAVGLPPFAGSLADGSSIGLPFGTLSWLLLPALAVAVALALRHRDVPRTLLAATLLLAVTLPAPRLGAPAADALPRVAAVPLDAAALDADEAAIRALRERSDGLAGRLPGAPGRPDALEARLAPARASLVALQAAQSAWIAQRDALARQLDERRAQIAELQSVGARGSIFNRAIAAGRIVELQAAIAQLQEAARPGLELARERADVARADAVARVVELRVGLDRERRLAMRHDAALRTGPYLLAAAATLAWLLWRTPLAGPWFATLAVGALGLALAAAWDGAPSPGGDAEGRGPRVALALHALFGALLASLLLRASFRAIQDNRELRPAFGRPQWRRALLRAAWIWSPAAATLAALHLLLGPAALDAALARLGCSGDDAACRGALLRDSDPTRDTLRIDLHGALDRLIAGAEARAVAAVEAVPGRGPDAASLARAAASEALDRHLPRRLADVDPRLRTDGCGLADAACHAAALLAGLLERACAAPRATLVESLAGPPPAAATTPATTAAARVATSRDGEPSPADRLRVPFEAVSRGAHAQLDAGLAALSSWFALKGALLLLLALRSFLHVLSRTLFAEDRDAYATMTPGERSAAEGVALTVTDGSRLELDVSGRTLFVRRSVDVDDAVPETALLPPQPLRATLARLRAGCWLLKRIDGGAPRGSAPVGRVTSDGDPGGIVTSEGAPGGAARRVTLQAAQGAQFVLWRIPPGGEVAFRWDRFVAMTGGLGLRRTVSAKLSGVATGRVTLHTARGPGLLVLRSHGAPGTAAVSVAPDRLLGWPLGTRFRIESSRAFASAWIDPCQVRAAEPGAAVIDAPRDGAGGRGALRDARGMFGG